MIENQKKQIPKYETSSKINEKSFFNVRKGDSFKINSETDNQLNYAINLLKS